MESRDHTGYLSSGPVAVLRWFAPFSWSSLTRSELPRNKIISFWFSPAFYVASFAHRFAVLIGSCWKSKGRHRCVATTFISGWTCDVCGIEAFGQTDAYVSLDTCSCVLCPACFKLSFLGQFANCILSVFFTFGFRRPQCCFGQCYPCWGPVHHIAVRWSATNWYRHYPPCTSRSHVRESLFLRI